MSQKRLQSYGDPIVASDVKELIGSLSQSVVLFGFDFFVDAPNRMSISAGAVVTAQGLIIRESESQYLIIDNTSEVKNYTVIYNHQDADIIGGNPAALELVLGLRASDPTGAVLGWVKYPGGSVPLTSSHFYPRRKSNITESNYLDDTYALIPPFIPKWFDVSNGGGTLTLTDKYDSSIPTALKTYVEIRNDDIVSGYKTVVLPMHSGLLPPGQIAVTAHCPVGSKLTVKLKAKDGTILTPDNNEITSTTTFIYRRMRIPKNTVVTQDSVFFIELRFDINFSKVMYIESVGYNTYNKPI